MSALPPKADIGTQSRNVRFVPKADIRSASFDRLVGDGEYSCGNGEAFSISIQRPIQHQR
jgi:hypothetical protein